MNISKKQYEYWSSLKFILAGGWMWILLNIPLPPEYKDINFYSVNIPIAILLILLIGGLSVIIEVDSKLKNEIGKWE